MAEHHDQLAAMSYAENVARLQRIENAALRVASSRDANGIVSDSKVLDALDSALEVQSHG